MGKSMKRMLCMAFIILVILGDLEAVRIKKEQEVTVKNSKESPKKPLELNIVDIHGAPTLSVNTKPKTFGLQFYKGQYRITTEEVPVLTFDDEKIDSGDLVYSTEDPVLNEAISSFGYPVWKAIKADLLFNDLDKSKITYCGELRIYGGRCKTSKQEINIKVDMPAHKKVRIAAVYHYFGGWLGFMSYLKVKIEGNLFYLWNEEFDNR